MSNIAHYSWQSLVRSVLKYGTETSPRGQKTTECLGIRTCVDMSYPVIVNARRKLGYKFMFAEAAWILSGDNRVATIKPYSKEIEKFSDDGLHFFGAYGPRFVDQIRHVLRALEIDQDSRQALMTFWRPNPPETKDVPCTINLHWMIRDGELHCFADMRSSDVWLGVPYDWFNFSMLTGYLILLLKERTGKKYELGTLYFYAHSQHIYERNFEYCVDICNERQDTLFQPPEFLVHSFETAQHLVGYLWMCANGACDEYKKGRIGYAPIEG